MIGTTIAPVAVLIAPTLMLIVPHLCEAVLLSYQTCEVQCIGQRLPTIFALTPCHHTSIKVLLTTCQMLNIRYMKRFICKVLSSWKRIFNNENKGAVKVSTIVDQKLTIDIPDSQLVVTSSQIALCITSIYLQIITFGRL